MKTVKLGKEILRVKEDKVENFLSRGFSLCPKSEWKKGVRDVEKVAKKEKEEKEVSEAKPTKKEKKAKK
jgi:hypothetical protein